MSWCQTFSLFHLFTCASWQVKKFLHNLLMGVLAGQDSSTFHTPSNNRLVPVFGPAKIRAMWIIFESLMRQIVNKAYERWEKLVGGDDRRESRDRRYPHSSASTVSKNTTVMRVRLVISGTPR